jgi:methyl-accepting chemotaxis protein
VRNLAQRAAGAAKNTSELIEGTIKKIKDGTVLVEKTNVDFGEVASSVTKVTELVGEISAASAEQSRGITEVSTAISQMDNVTQGNAASAEKIASASEELSAQALSMEEILRGLDVLVKGEGNAKAQTASASQAAPVVRRKTPLPARGAKSPDGRTARAAVGGGKPAGGNGKYPGGSGKTHPARNPEDLIPLDEKSMAEF